MAKLVSINFPSSPAISLRQGQVVDDLPGKTEKGVLWQVAPQRFLLKVPQVAKYLVESGSRVTIEPAPEAGPDQVSRFFHMAPLAALIFQRGQLALHAAAAVPAPGKGDGAILIAGDSGAGKSTLLVALRKRGWHILGDDLAVIMENDVDRPSLLPIAQEVMIWEDALDQLGLGERIAPVHHGGLWVVDRISFSEKVAPTCWPIAKIFLLSVSKQSGIEQKALEGIKTFQAVGSMVYNSHIADALLSREDYLRQAGMIAQNVPIISLRRPRGQWSVEALADIVQNSVQIERVGGNGDL